MVNTGPRRETEALYQLLPDTWSCHRPFRRGGCEGWAGDCQPCSREAVCGCWCRSPAHTAALLVWGLGRRWGRVSLGGLTSACSVPCGVFSLLYGNYFVAHVGVGQLPAANLSRLKIPYSCSTACEPWGPCEDLNLQSPTQACREYNHAFRNPAFLATCDKSCLSPAAPAPPSLKLYSQDWETQKAFE